MSGTSGRKSRKVSTSPTVSRADLAELSPFLFAQLLSFFIKISPKFHQNFMRFSGSKRGLRPTSSPPPAAVVPSL